MKARLNSAANRYYLKIKDSRKAWKLRQVQACWWCGRGDCSLEIHEVCRKSQAQGRWGHPANYALLCHECHANHFDTMPFALQLFVKRLRNPSEFSLKEWIRIRDRGQEEVTMQDILEAGRNISLPVLRPKNSLKF